MLLDVDVPGASATGGTLTCDVTSVMLMGTGSSFCQAAAPPDGRHRSTYVLTVTGASGCTSTANALVDEDLDLPGASASGGTLTCDVTSVMLMGGGNGSCNWTGPGGRSTRTRGRHGRHLRAHRDRPTDAQPGFR